MRIKVTFIHSVVALTLLAFCSFGTGCWMTRTWKDYVPITEVGLRPGVRSYTGYFFPRITGGHVLALRIKQNAPLETFVGLRFHGEIKLFHDGCETSIPFDTVIERLSLPPIPFKVHLKTFEAHAIERSDDYGRFDIMVEGNINDFLEREPNSHLSVSFCDAE